MLDNANLGTFDPPSSTTSQSGVAETELTAKTEIGETVLFAKVHYTVGGEDYVKEFAVGLIDMQSPPPDNYELTSSKEWVIANGYDKAIITLNATYEGRPVPGLLVDFTLQEYEMGTIDQADEVTDQNGLATVRFNTLKKSGNASISVYTLYKHEELEKVMEVQYTQKVDHDTPYQLDSYNVPTMISVGSSAPVTLRYVDAWGNPVDNRNLAEEVYFEISSTAEDATFLDANPPYTSIQQPVDLSGSATVWFRASESPGLNVILADPLMEDIESKYFFIQGVTNKSPILIEQDFHPEGYLDNPPKQYADGVSLYQIVYTLIDEFGNGVSNSPIYVETNIPGEEKTIYTNAIGEAMLTYGPKTSIGHITITATSLDNTSVSCSKEVWFISQEAVDMQFTVIPESMPSRDVEGWAPALLMAKVIDENGNPVEGEEVTFSLGTPVYEETYEVTMEPELVSETAISNIDGYAISYFNPGAFTVDWQHLHYDDTATGTIPITAEWENVTRGEYSSQTLSVSWKNYPYLSLETEVSPQTVNVTGIVDVLIRLKGDGWALHPKPIDVVLCTDRSGSMLMDEPDRMVSVMDASKAFVGSMHVSPTRDHIGLVSFGTDGWAKLSPEYRYFDDETVYCYGYSGWKYRDLTGYYYDWTNMYGVYRYDYRYYIDSGTGFKWIYRDSYWDMPTSSGLPSYYQTRYWPYTEEYDTNSDHQNYINTHYPGDNRFYGYYAVVEEPLNINPTLVNSSIDRMVPASGTPLRYGVYKAINEVLDNGREKAIKAIIVLSDGDYNYYGDPLARDPDEGHTSWSPTSYGNLDDDWHRFSELTSSEQNMATYATNNDIRIYSIGFAEDISTGGRDTLRILAESTGGKYYDADAANIAEIYKIIAGDLQEEAGVDTEVNLNFGQIEVNYELVTINETYKVFDYIPDTDVDSYHANLTKPIHDPPYPYSVNQTNEWESTNKLTFDVGNVYLGQVWEARYQLRILTDGNINLFGPGSQVVFNEGTAFLNFPKTYITGVPGMITTGVNSSELDVDVGDSSYDPDSGYMEWPIYRSYSGSMNVTEFYYISNDAGMTWMLIGSAELTPEQANTDGVFRYPKVLLPPGEILFKVVANAPDAPGPVIANPPPPPPAEPTPGLRYITLK
ncbi:MAG: hypothetical protein APR55_02075 [Methanolinea sp. SDB]|nr:MAG: hypothetical protein APR55_02075 [Methanolinea sp. SDB]